MKNYIINKEQREKNDMKLCINEIKIENFNCNEFLFRNCFACLQHNSRKFLCHKEKPRGEKIFNFRKNIFTAPVATVSTVSDG